MTSILINPSTIQDNPASGSGVIDKSTIDSPSMGSCAINNLPLGTSISDVHERDLHVRDFPGVAAATKDLPVDDPSSPTPVGTKVLASLSRPLAFAGTSHARQPTPTSLEAAGGAPGWIIVDKALGQTSMNATYQVRKAFGLRKAGHAGTLDPLATGILPVALGQTTALIPYVMTLPKAYTFTVCWGSATTTDDRLGQICAQSPVRPTRNQIIQRLPEFVGNISQTPPAYCAAKIAGIPAYTRARRGEDVQLCPRQVQIFDLQLKDHRDGETDFWVLCGSGTYVRALGRDLALTLGTLGHLTALRRVQVGPWKEGLSTQDLWSLAKSAPPPKWASPQAHPDCAPPALYAPNLAPSPAFPGASSGSHFVRGPNPTLDSTPHPNAQGHHAGNCALHHRHIQPADLVLPADMARIRVSDWGRSQLWNGQVLDLEACCGHWHWIQPPAGSASDPAPTQLAHPPYQALPHARVSPSQAPLQTAPIACYDGQSRLVAVAKLTTGRLAPCRCFMERL